MVLVYKAAHVGSAAPFFFILPVSRSAGLKTSPLPIWARLHRTALRWRTPQGANAAVARYQPSDVITVELADGKIAFGKRAGGREKKQERNVSAPGGRA